MFIYLGATEYFIMINSKLFLFLANKKEKNPQ